MWCHYCDFTYFPLCCLSYVLFAEDAATSQVNDLVRAGCTDEELAAVLLDSESHLQDVLPENMAYYQEFLSKLQEAKGDEVKRVECYVTSVFILYMIIAALLSSMETLIE